MFKRLLPLLLISAALLLGSCTSEPTTVSRIAADESIDLSGRWNDTDSRLVAETMIDSLINGRWLGKFREEEGRDPVVIVGYISNRSSEHIETQTFTKDIERELVNSGEVTFVASSQERLQLREEKLDQQGNATEETMAALAAETGADYMLSGVFTSQTDAADGKKVVLYTVDMEMLDIETNQKVWIDSKDIKKYIERSKNSW
ncbi:MAG: penicillin-binding protein activator LpoB [Spirochaetales bacterium]|nr:penicillin-binding protein activator LpoB [Spirochaetales bacterium]